MKRLTLPAFGLLGLLLAVCFAGCSAGCSSSNTGSLGAGGDTSSSGGTAGSSSGIHRIDSGLPASGNAAGGSSGSTAGGSGSGTTDGDGGQCTLSDDAGSMCEMSVSQYPSQTWTPAVAEQGVCVTADIQAFLTACVDQSSTQDSCNAWFDTNAPPPDGGAGTACGNCLFPPSGDDNGGIWVDPFGIPGPNYPACVQLKDATNGAACAAAMNDAFSCDGVACDGCNDDSDYQCCISTSDATSCSSYSSALQSSCKADFSQGGAYEQCAPSLTSNNVDDDFILIANMICGNGDGG